MAPRLAHLQTEVLTWGREAHAKGAPSTRFWHSAPCRLQHAVRRHKRGHGTIKPHLNKSLGVMKPWRPANTLLLARWRCSSRMTATSLEA
jgi:hypothetical protein